MSRLFRSHFLNGQANTPKSRLLLDKQLSLFWSVSASIFVLLLLLGSWLSYASLEFTLSAKGITLPLGGVRDVNSPATGQITEITSQSGERVWAGKVLARLQNPEKALEYAEQRDIYQLSAEKTNLEIQQLKLVSDSEQQNLSLQLAHLELKLSFLNTLKTQFTHAISTNEKAGKKSLNTQRQHLAKLKQQYQGYLQKLDKLKQKGFVSDTALLDRASGLESLINSLSEIERQGYRSSVDHNLSLSELGRLQDEIAQTQEAQQQAQFSLSQLSQQLQIDSAALVLAKRQAEKKLLDAERNWWRDTQILAPFDGQLLSLTLGLGKTLKQGDPFAIMALSSQHKKHLLTLSPRAKSGSLTLQLGTETFELTVDSNLDAVYQALALKLAPLFSDTAFDYAITEAGLILVALPATTQPALSLDSLAITHNHLLDAQGVPVFANLLTLGDNWQYDSQVNVSIIPERQAKRLATGMALFALPSHQSQWLDPSIAGEIIQISDYPMTALEIENLVGSKQLATTLSSNAKGHVVISRLHQADSMTTATLTNNQFVLGERRPIELLIPFIDDVIHNNHTSEK